MNACPGSPRRILSTIPKLPARLRHPVCHPVSAFGMDRIGHKIFLSILRARRSAVARWRASAVISTSSLASSASTIKLSVHSCPLPRAIVPSIVLHPIGQSQVAGAERSRTIRCTRRIPLSAATKRVATAPPLPLRRPRSRLGALGFLQRWTAIIPYLHIGGSIVDWHSRSDGSGM